MKHIVVTGGAGFIGSHLVDKLVSSGFNVTVLDDFSTGSIDNLTGHSCIDVIEQDLSITGSWQSLLRECNYCFHLAGLASIVPSIEDPLSYYHANVTATANVLASVGTSLEMLVYSASASCYGKKPVIPTCEDSNISTEYPYALTKYLGEQLVLHWNKVYHTPTVSTRLFNVYGPRSRAGDSYGAVLTTFLGQIANNLPLTIVGDGNQQRDFTYVSDIVKGLILASHHGIPGSIYNLGSGLARSVLDMASLLSSNHVFIPKRPGEPDVTLADITKARTQLGYNPEVTLEEGLELVLSSLSSIRNLKGWTSSDILGATRAWFRYLS